MKSPRATLAASAIPLLLTSLPLMAGELPFNTPAAAQAKVSAPLHWSAYIGTGESESRTEKPTPSIQNNGDAKTADGTHASPDWTASIGTGTAAASNTRVIDTKQTSSSDTQAVVASADWTSKIGTGHAADSGKRAMYASLVSSK